MVTVSQEKSVTADQECVYPLLDHIRKRLVNLPQAARIYKYVTLAESLCRNLYLSRFSLGIERIGRIAQVGNRRGLRQQFMQQLDPLRSHFHQEQHDPGDICAWLAEAVHEAD